MISTRVSVGLLPCPRCGAPLSEIDYDMKWLRFRECSDCLVTWYFIGVELVQGRKLRPEWAMSEATCRYSLVK